MPVDGSTSAELSAAVPILRMNKNDHSREGLTDRNLVTSLRSGNTKAFEVLFYRYRIPIFNLAYRMVGNKEEAQDLTQETFIKVLKGIDTFDSERNFFSWLYKIATNVCLDHLRKQSRQPKKSSEPMDIDGGVEVGLIAVDSSLDFIDRKATQEAVSEALKKLSEHYRLILILRELQGLKYAEIAEIMDISIYSVQTTLFRARKLFKKEYKLIEELFND